MLKIWLTMAYNPALRRKLIAEIGSDYVTGFEDVCDFLEEIDPEEFRRMFPGGKEECYRLARQKAIGQFRDWLQRYPKQMMQYLKSAEYEQQILQDLGLS